MTSERTPTDDPFTAPAPTMPIGALEPRLAASVTGVVVSVADGGWVGGPVLEVVLHDGTGDVVLAFLGRRAIGGIACGRRLAVAGVVGTRDGVLVMRNPAYWLLDGDMVSSGRDMVSSGHPALRSRAAAPPLANVALTR